MLLSGGDDKLDMDNWIAASSKHKFQLHAFDLHDELINTERFKCVSEAGVVGAYYHCFPNTSKIPEAFEAFVSGLKSVVATSVKVTLSGDYRWKRGNNIIHIADMHACEQKSFIVCLQNSASSDRQQQEELRLSVNVDYLEGSTKKKAITITRNSDVVAAEMVRFELVTQLRESVVGASNKTTEAHGDLMSATYEAIKDKYSVWFHDANYSWSSGVLKLIKEDVDEVLSTDQEYQQAYVVSWLSCHWWQRATCTVSQSRHSGAFRQCQNPVVRDITRGQERTTGLFLAPWCGRPWLVAGLAGVVLLLFILLLRLLIIGGWWQPSAIDPRMRPFNMTGLDVVRPSVQKELLGMFDRAKENNITSFFNHTGASAVDMNYQIDQFLYRVRTYLTIQGSSLFYTYIYIYLASFNSLYIIAWIDACRLFCTPLFFVPAMTAHNPFPRRW